MIGLVVRHLRRLGDALRPAPDAACRRSRSALAIALAGAARRPLRVVPQARPERQGLRHAARRATAACSTASTRCSSRRRRRTSRCSRSGGLIDARAAQAGARARARGRGGRAGRAARRRPRAGRVPRGGGAATGRATSSPLPSSYGRLVGDVEGRRARRRRSGGGGVVRSAARRRRDVADRRGTRSRIAALIADDAAARGARPRRRCAPAATRSAARPLRSPRIADDDDRGRATLRSQRSRRDFAVARRAPHRRSRSPTPQCFSQHCWQRSRSATLTPVKRLALLGATGSIGRQALDVVDALPDIRVVALAAGSDDRELVRARRAHGVDTIALADREAAERARARLRRAACSRARRRRGARCRDRRRPRAERRRRRRRARRDARGARGRHRRRARQQGEPRRRRPARAAPRARAQRRHAAAGRLRALGAAPAAARRVGRRRSSRSS